MSWDDLAKGVTEERGVGDDDDKGRMRLRPSAGRSESLSPPAFPRIVSRTHCLTPAFSFQSALDQDIRRERKSSYGGSVWWRQSESPSVWSRGGHPQRNLTEETPRDILKV